MLGIELNCFPVYAPIQRFSLTESIHLSSLAEQLALKVPCLHLPKLELQVTTTPTWHFQGSWGSNGLLFSMKQRSKTSSVKVGKETSEPRAWLVLFSAGSGLKNEALIIEVAYSTEYHLGHFP